MSRINYTKGAFRGRQGSSIEPVQYANSLDEALAELRRCQASSTTARKPVVVTLPSVGEWWPMKDGLHNG